MNPEDEGTVACFHRLRSDCPLPSVRGCLMFARTHIHGLTASAGNGSISLCVFVFFFEKEKKIVFFNEW